jgi:hypothetical protein
MSRFMSMYAKRIGIPILFAYILCLTDLVRIDVPNGNAWVRVEFCTARSSTGGNKRGREEENKKRTCMGGR